MSACSATANPRSGLTLRCDRTEGHEVLESFDSLALKPHWHYDFHQDALWSAGSYVVKDVEGSEDTTVVEFRTVGGAR